MPVVRTWQLTAGAAVVGLALAAGVVTAAGPWESGRRTAEIQRAAAQDLTPRTGPGRPAPAPSAPTVLAAVGAARTPAPADGKVGQDLGRELGALLGDAGLGPLRTASVVDLATGRQLYGSGAANPMTPASTIKIATTVAALSALGPDHRIPTTTALTADGRVALVGGGDASLTTARLRTLAERTARALRERGVASVRLVYDTSRYGGPVLHPIGINGNIAPVTALMVDQGRLDPAATGDSPRTDDPAGDAARAFGGMLTAEGIKLTAPAVPGRPGKGPQQLAKVLSPPLSTLVERTLTESDNDIAESLARQTAVKAGEEASFAGAGRAVRAELARLKLPLAGARFADGSGLDRADRVSATLLTALLARAAGPDRPELRPVLTGLPVAGFSGTLRSRHTGSSPGTGLIRAKTGTLTGVNSLSGTVVASDGRLLGFAFLAGRTPSRDEAQSALDRLAGALVS
ncbi:D-alanyl-D-alanine carboxypeptidase/D-alanyl-D-alanine-endopeptidase [Streptomyces sp. NPDC020965]|uniref:D-alanyl-D-alanine carboxypeptidase/D-alanyl-D-alanine endopeptidase n=1 Tax=Streptomyces sp. NPDC020965 TaxID=3365105 RepID=UPI0037BE0EA0